LSVVDDEPSPDVGSTGFVASLQWHDPHAVVDDVLLSASSARAAL